MSYKGHHIEISHTGWHGWEVGVCPYYGHTWTREYNLPDERAALERGKELIDKGLLRYAVYDPDTKRVTFVDPREDEK